MRVDITLGGCCISFAAHLVKLHAEQRGGDEDQGASDQDGAEIYDWDACQQHQDAAVQRGPDIPTEFRFRLPGADGDQIRDHSKDHLGEHAQGDQVNTQPA